MAFKNTQLPVKLPIFKDKVMYIGASQNKNKVEQSYVVSASFNGILRLSPNNYNTIYEENPIELSATQDQAMSSSYSDAIVFENVAENNTQTDADIRKRMIICSDSDGYLVNFRLSDLSLEFDNLGVIGITKTSKLTIYSNDSFSDSQAFILGNTVMPSLPNGNVGTIRGYIPSEYPENYDEIKIVITGDGDDSYILHGEPNKDDRREFSYKRTQQFIRDVILESLLDFQSVPTGSIHWCPVSWEQYKSLVEKGQYPNRYKKVKGEGACDPIIRDYLLCDGRKYKCEEFPELAKILMHSKVTYWDENNNIQTHRNTEGEKDENGIVSKYPDYFRVPDLRTKFISYCYTKGVENALNNEVPDVSSFLASDMEKDGINEWNQTGTYVPDNSPKTPSGQTGEHFHFLAYGTYSPYNLTYTENNSVVGDINDLYKFEGYTDLSMPANSKIRLWYLNNTPTDLSKNGGIGGFAYGFGSSGNRRRSQSSQDIITAWSYVSAPAGGFNSFKQNPDVGLSSESFTTYINPSSNNETYKVTQYETIDDYNPLEYNVNEKTVDVDGVETKTYIAKRYGYENAPKFYAFLPLIRI